MNGYGVFLIFGGVWFVAHAVIVFSGKTSEQLNKVTLGVLLLIHAGDFIWKAAKVIQ